MVVLEILHIYTRLVALQQIFLPLDQRACRINVLVVEMAKTYAEFPSAYLLVFGAPHWLGPRSLSLRRGSSRCFCVLRLY